MPRIALVLCPVFCLLGCLALAGENWTQFRGPRGDGLTAETGLPVTWSETENIAWKTPIHGRAWSSPVIWEDQVWMTTATEDGKELFAVCVDRESGKHRARHQGVRHCRAAVLLRAQ